MELAADLPVKLVVKAANQRVADQTVECLLGWTIRKLKQHLENVYPSKPKHHHQKLIYSGRLLADHLTLKEVLRQYDIDNNRHTVHLVCSPSAESVSQSQLTSLQVGAADMKTESRTSMTSSASSESDGLRQHSASTSTINLPNAGANPAMPIPGATSMMGMPGFQGVPMMGAAGYPYTPEQLAYMQQMQQMYYQQMAQYMQYYGYQPPTLPQTVPQTAAAAWPEQPANPNMVNNARPNQNMRMNAQGGLEEDDEDFEQRDWLDYIYVFFRFLVLMSIVYFYSTMSRFLGVAVGFLVIYILQNGWFNRQQEAPQPPRPQQPPQQQQQEQQQQENTQEEQSGQDGGAQQAGSQNTDTPPSTQQPAPQPESPSAVEIFLRMFTTFFTSLMPARPPVVNGN